MRAVAHGWKKPGGGGPSRAVAKEFVNADRKYSGGFAENRYNTGGLAAMNEINSGVPVTLNFQGGGYYPGDLYGDSYYSDMWERDYDYGGGDVHAAPPAHTQPPTWNAPSGWQYGTQPLSYQAAMDMDDLTGMQSNLMGPYVNLRQEGWTQVADPNAPNDLRATMWYPPGDTSQGGVEPTIGAPGGETPSPGFGSNVRSPNVVRGVQQEAEQAAERTAADAARRQSPYRDQLREHKARVVAALNPAPLPMAKPIRSGGNMMSGQMVPPGAVGGDLQNPIYAFPGAKGGYMNYQAGGEVTTQPFRRTPVTGGGPAIPGHSEGTNPFLPGEKRYEEWEEKYHWFDPSATAPMPAPDEGGGITAWLLEKLGYGNVEAAATRSETELTELGEARGGRVGYQGGGLAQAQGRRGGGFRRPRGGVPPTLRGQTPRAGGIPPQMDAGAKPRRPMPGQRGGVPGQRYAGGSPGFYAPGGPGRGGGARADLGPGGRGVPGLPAGGRFGEEMRRARGQQSYQDVVNRGGGGINPRLPGGGRMYGTGSPGGGGGMSAQVVPPGATGGSMNRPIYGGGARASEPGGEGVTGGARVPPNLQGSLQKQRMMNRPPSNVGGGVNRVGQGDQQGALSRALQRGTGRPPMSRRGGFGRRRSQ